ncbi:hypothetical protein [Peribacillus butanolivorans]|uniref:hypothetical protein n=1 Tax=Peribacillus butanolivorans TaxID=421767 RepID=UPI00364EEF6A
MKNIFLKDNLNPNIQAVKSAMKGTKDPRIFKRYQSILMHLKGQPIKKQLAEYKENASKHRWFV